jgi:hypothetical protein
MAVAESLPSLHKVKERMQKAPKDGPLENLAHGDNLWPDAGLWDGATEFVSLRETLFVIAADGKCLSERACFAILVSGDTPVGLSP